MSGYEAFIELDWMRNVVRLHVRRVVGSHAEYLMADGNWQAVEEGTLIEDSGLTLPAGAIEAVAVAIQEFQGHTSHADTEARVLREWLAVERGRVDKVLGV